MALELALLIIAVAVLSAGAGFFFRRKRIVVQPSTYAVDAGHKHAGVYFDSHGWRCQCGEHIHRYSLPDGERPGRRRCLCGEKEKVSE